MIEVAAVAVAAVVVVAAAAALVRPVTVAPVATPWPHKQYHVTQVQCATRKQHPMAMMLLLLWPLSMPCNNSYANVKQNIISVTCGRKRY